MNEFYFVNKFDRTKQNPLEIVDFKGFEYGRHKQTRTADPHHVKVVL